VIGFRLSVQRPQSGCVHVLLHGPLDLAHAYRFDDALRRLEHEHPDCLVIDLRGLDFLDSTGLSRLVAARRRARRAGRRLVLVRGPKPIQRLFSLVALNEHFETVNDVADLQLAT